MEPPPPPAAQGFQEVGEEKYIDATRYFFPDSGSHDAAAAAADEVRESTIRCAAPVLHRRLRSHGATPIHVARQATEFDSVCRYVNDFTTRFSSCLGTFVDAVGDICEDSRDNLAKIRRHYLALEMLGIKKSSISERHGGLLTEQHKILIEDLRAARQTVSDVKPGEKDYVLPHSELCSALLRRRAQKDPQLAIYAYQIQTMDKSLIKEKYNLQIKMEKLIERGKGHLKDILEQNQNIVWDNFLYVLEEVESMALEFINDKYDDIYKVLMCGGVPKKERAKRRKNFLSLALKTVDNIKTVAGKILLLRKLEESLRKDFSGLLHGDFLSAEVRDLRLTLSEFRCEKDRLFYGKQRKEEFTRKQTKCFSFVDGRNHHGDICRISHANFDGVKYRIQDIKKTALEKVEEQRENLQESLVMFLKPFLKVAKRHVKEDLAELQAYIADGDGAAEVLKVEPHNVEFPLTIERYFYRETLVIDNVDGQGKTKFIVAKSSFLTMRAEVKDRIEMLEKLKQACSHREIERLIRSKDPEKAIEQFFCGESDYWSDYLDSKIESPS